MDSDYGIKIALMNEYKRTLEFKKMYEELTESFRYIIGDLFDYATKNKIDLPNRDGVYRNMEKAEQLIKYRISNSERLIPPTDFQQRNKTPDDSTEYMFMNFSLISSIVTKLSSPVLFFIFY